MDGMSAGIGMILAGTSRLVLSVNLQTMEECFRQISSERFRPSPWTFLYVRRMIPTSD
jgi:hypothetical protein